MYKCHCKALSNTLIILNIIIGTYSRLKSRKHLIQKILNTSFFS